jgi:hypothetical protein
VIRLRTPESLNCGEGIRKEKMQMNACYAADQEDCNFMHNLMQQNAFRDHESSYPTARRTGSHGQMVARREVASIAAIAAGNLRICHSLVASWFTRHGRS